MNSTAPDQEKLEMPNIYGDQRECMKQIDQMMAEQANQRQTPGIYGEVQHINNIWIFSHFDSRGGSLMTQASNAIKAMQAYIEIMGHEPDSDLAINTAQEDLVGKFEVVTMGKPLPEEGELLKDYTEDGEGFTSFQLMQNFVGTPDWFPLNTLVLSSTHQIPENEEDVIEVQTDKTNATICRYGLRYWSLGEDACGLYYFK